MSGDTEGFKRLCSSDTMDPLRIIVWSLPSHFSRIMLFDSILLFLLPTSISMHTHIMPITKMTFRIYTKAVKQFFLKGGLSENDVMSQKRENCIMPHHVTGYLMQMHVRIYKDSHLWSLNGINGIGE